MFIQQTTLVYIVRNLIVDWNVNQVVLCVVLANGTSRPCHFVLAEQCSATYCKANSQQRGRNRYVSVAGSLLQPLCLGTRAGVVIERELYQTAL